MSGNRRLRGTFFLLIFVTISFPFSHSLLLFTPTLLHSASPSTGFHSSPQPVPPSPSPVATQPVPNKQPSTPPPSSSPFFVPLACSLLPTSSLPPFPLGLFRFALVVLPCLLFFFLRVSAFTPFSASFLVSLFLPFPWGSFSGLLLSVTEG